MIDASLIWTSRIRDWDRILNQLRISYRIYKAADLWISKKKTYPETLQLLQA